MSLVGSAPTIELLLSGCRIKISVGFLDLGKLLGYVSRACHYLWSLPAPTHHFSHPVLPLHVFLPCQKFLLLASGRTYQWDPLPLAQQPCTIARPSASGAPVPLAQKYLMALFSTVGSELAPEPIGIGLHLCISIHGVVL